MTAIPEGTQFVGLSASTKIVEKKSAQNNSSQAIYTIKDIAAAAVTTKTTIVNIKSEKIYGLSLPADLLEAADVGAYNSIDKIIVEYTPGHTPFTGGSNLKIEANGTSAIIDSSLITNESKAYIEIRELHCFPETTVNVFYPEGLNLGLYLTVVGADFATGDGTIRVIITYTIRKFGA